MGKSQLNAFATPNKPSAFDLSILAKSPSNIFETPPIKSLISLLIPPIILLNKAPTYWSPIQDTKFSTLSKSPVNKSLTEPNILSVMFLAAHGKKFCIALVGPTIATWALFAAIFAIAVFWVANRTFP